MGEQYKRPDSFEEAAMDIHEWLFKEGQGDTKCRAYQLDDLMSKYRNGRVAFKTIVWLGTFVGGAATAWAKFGGGLK